MGFDNPVSHFFDSMSRGIRTAVRGLRRAPLVSITVIVTLACCIGVNAVIFSVADQVFLKPLPYPQPDRLALVTTVTEDGGDRKVRTAQSGVTWEALEQGEHALETAVYSPRAQGVNLVADQRPSFVEQQRVSRGFFETLRATPALGRSFTAEEDRSGGPAVVVLSHAVWQQFFEADPRVLGRSISLKGEPHTVVGVMPSDFRGLTEADLWTPLKPSAGAEGGGTNYEILVRVPESTSWAEARDRIRRLGEALLPQQDSGVSTHLGLVSLREGLTRQARRPLKILGSAALFVLLIGCLNVAALLLVQFRQRSAEVATQLALGAKRSDLVRSFLAEQTLVAVVSGGLGALIGVLGLRYLKSTEQGPSVLLQHAEVDGRFLTVAFGLSALSLLLVTLGPAFRAGRLNLRDAFADRARGVTSKKAADRSRHLIVVGEVALAFALLIGAGLLLRSLAHLSNLQPGFDADRVYAATVSLEEARYADSERVDRLYTQSLAALEADPGVESAAVALGVPFERWLNLDVRRLDRPEKRELSDLIYVTPDYFDVLRIPLLAGRTFTDYDDAESLDVVIVSESFVERYFPDRDPLGTTIEVSGGKRQIVGIVGDVQRVPGWGGGAPLASVPAAFVPARQLSDRFFEMVHIWFSPVWVVRARSEDPRVFSAVRSAIASVDPLLPVGDTRSLEEAALTALGFQRFQTLLAGIFAALALLLTAVGLHGLLAQSVLERRQEMGIRLALGASRGEAIAEAARPGLLSVGLGIAVGLVLALLSGRWLEHVLWGVQPNDFPTLLAVTAIFLLIGLEAALFSAFKVVKRQPSSILRSFSGP